jgi:predicted small secreted protein
MSKIRIGAIACLALSSLLVVGCGSDDSSTSASVSDGSKSGADSDAPSDIDSDAFCGVAVPATKDADLADDLDARAESLRSVAGEMPDDLKAALNVSADAMSSMAAASKNDPSGAELAKLVEELSENTELTKAQELIESTVAAKCATMEGEG